MVNKTNFEIIHVVVNKLCQATEVEMDEREADDGEDEGEAAQSHGNQEETLDLLHIRRMERESRAASSLLYSCRLSSVSSFR